MKISEFYQNILGANLTNSRWSWGAVDPVANRVYLRVWEDLIENVEDGQRVIVLNDAPQTSRGRPERERHLEAIRNGAEGFGVVCVASFQPAADSRQIKAFDDKELLAFDGLTEENGSTYATFRSRIPVAELAARQTAHSTLSRDIKAVLSRKQIDATTKEALIDARIGQGMFRAAVLKIWGNRCAVTGCRTLDAVRASHIKPWRDSTDEERLDPSNGLPLVATLDALFDAGLISFSDTGEMLVAPKIAAEERTRLSVHRQRLLSAVPVEMAGYLAHHRKEVFGRQGDG